MKIVNKSALSVLIVEDEFLVAADIEESLESLGYKIQNTVASGEAAIAEVEKNLPDIILMDIVLKGEMSGIEAAIMIQHKHNVPIIYLTANADVSTVEKAKLSLPYGYILKPFTDKELHTVIEVARFKFESDIKYKMDSDQFNRFFKQAVQDENDIKIIESSDGLEKIDLKKVYFVESGNNQTLIHMLNDIVIAKTAMAELEHYFPAETFVRVSKDYLINVQKIFLVKLPEIIIADKMTVIVVEDKYKREIEDRIK